MEQQCWMVVQVVYRMWETYGTVGYASDIASYHHRSSQRQVELPNAYPNRMMTRVSAQCIHTEMESFILDAALCVHA